MHLTALYDLERRTYADALLQPVHEKDEFRAFCTMADRLEPVPGTKNIYTGDRGFLRQPTGKDWINVIALLVKELVPIREGRQKPRLKTAHFRRPRYFTYRAS